MLGGKVNALRVRNQRKRRPRKCKEFLVHEYSTPKPRRRASVSCPMAGFPGSYNYPTFLSATATVKGGIWI